MYQYKKLFICLMISSVLIWAGCEQSTGVEVNTPPPNSQVSGGNTKAKTNTSLPELVPNRYIVVFKDQGEGRITEESAQQAVQRIQALLSDFSIQQDSIIHQYKYALKGFAAQLTPLQVELLEKDSRVETVVQDIKYKAIQMVAPNNLVAVNMVMAGQVTPWGVTRVGGPLNGIGKKAWILDTGIDLGPYGLGHNDLNVDVSNSVSFVATESADDLNGHGTHVAGIIAAKNNSIGVVGVAAGADVVAVKVCNSGGYCYTSDVNAGVDYIVSQYSAGDVANISLGWPVSGDPYIDLPLSILEATIKAAADDGLKFAIAAGNEAQHANNKSPARIVYDNVWTVSAFDNQDKFASFSNYGNPPIDYGGPGVDILSLWKNGGTNTINGTSMAAPHLAGLLLAVPNDISIDGHVSNDPDGNPDKIAAYAPIVLSAPYIFASVVNGYPKISWSAVANAQSYKVYRRIEDGSWSLYSTTASTSITDYSQYSSSISVISNPHPVWSNKLSYRVKAAASGVNDSPYSNLVYFSKTGTGGPIK